jgi:Domain of unknown function (DUF4760)
MLTTEQVQNYGLWLQSGAIFLTFCGVIISAAVTRGVARRRATLDLIMGEESNELILTTRQKYLELRATGHMVQWADPTKASSDEAKILRSILNRYELIAIGIHKKTLNAALYKVFARTGVVRDWIACKPFVIQRRQSTSSPKLYIEFEKLAKKWASRDERSQC